MSSDSSEDELEKIVFGGSSRKILDCIDKTAKASVDVEPTGDAPLFDFIIDTAGSHFDESNKDLINKTKQNSKNVVDNNDRPTEGHPLWVDPDDETLEVEISKTKRLRKLRSNKDEMAISGSLYTTRLRAQYEELHEPPAWATNFKPAGKTLGWVIGPKTISFIDPCRDIDRQKELFLTTAAPISKGAVKRRTAEHLWMIQVKDANKSAPTSTSLSSVEFHPNSKVVLTAGHNQRIDLFKINGKKNEHIQSVKLEKFPVWCCAFNGTSEIIASSRKPFFYVHDLEKNIGSYDNHIRGRHEVRWDRFWISNQSNLIAFKGEGGYIPLVCLKSKQWIDNLKISGTFNYGCFTADGKQFFAIGNGGDVYCWDVGMRKCVYKFADEGCVCGTALAVSAGTHHLATGSSTGVVNLYDCENLSQRIASKIHGNHETNKHSLAPVKTIMNLTTAITCAKFSRTGEALFIASKEQLGSARMVVNMHTRTVVAGWPPKHVDIGCVQSCDFSPDGQWLAAVNHRGRALLYRHPYIDNVKRADTKTEREHGKL